MSCLHQERITKMKNPIISIPRASEELIKSLIRAGILFVDENGVHVKENYE